MQDNEQHASPQVRIERHYPYSAEKVWRAWTEPRALSRWFGGMRPGSVGEAQVDLRVGGRYRMVSRVPGGETHDVSGEYLEVVPHRRLAFTWAWHSTPERVSRVAIDLSEADGGTLLRFVHDRFFDDQARANHERGWQPAFDRLGDFLLQLDMQEV
ncbi:SRPBCC domain-containing protein [Roseateles sp.]|uniref:SRPBCC family protein n=1 Tax=Roseateles sp. TaxID=1971397 RepID=UPI0025D37D66|nr:SRPBCC domain-containing protein [Roseateles sp.]MBV8035912.1 SRPBCC domain-containing protein [Roseateles sp.]